MATKRIIVESTESTSDKPVDFVNPILEYAGLNEVNLWVDNPRKNDSNLGKLAREIVTHGQRAPIVVWRQDKVVYKGNTTLKALRYVAGLTPPQWDEFVKPIQQAKAALGMPTGQLYRPIKVLVMWVDFPNAAAAKSFGMSDNKTSEWTEWDEDKLDKLMDDLRATVKDSGSLQILETLTAFSESEISSLSLIPDLDKIKNKVQRDDGLTGVVKLLCKAEDRDTLVAWLEEALPDAKFIGVEIKGA